MFRALSTLAILAAASSMFACSSDDSASSNDERSLDNVMAADTKILATVDVEYGTLEFYKTTSEDGTVNYGVSEYSSVYAASTPFTTTMANERHTLLEVFMGVAPDQEPPEELAAIHAAEAKQLGRETDAIEPAPFDRAAPVEKAAAGCVSHIWQSPASNCYAWKNKLELTTTGGDWLPVGDNSGDFDHRTGESVTMGVCNATSTPTVAHFLFNNDPNDGYYHWRRDPVSLAAYQQVRDWWVTSSVWGPDCTGYPVCFPNLHPAKYAVTHDPGANATLMTAEAYYTGGCLL